MAGFTPVNPVKRARPSAPRGVSVDTGRDDDRTPDSGSPATDDNASGAGSVTTKAGTALDSRDEVSSSEGSGTSTPEPGTDTKQSISRPARSRDHRNNKTASSQQFDMGSVRTRSAYTGVEDMRSRITGAKAAPVFRPSMHQFADPIGYIASIAATGRDHGVVKIIPPAEWQPSFRLDTDRMRFRARLQKINAHEPNGKRARSSFLAKLYRYHRDVRKAPISKIPSIDKRPLDLYHLHEAVVSKGGFEVVCSRKLWAQVGRELGYSGKIMTSLSTSLKSTYQRFLWPYDRYLAGDGSSSEPAAQVPEESLDLAESGSTTPTPGIGAGSTPAPTSESPSAKRERSVESDTTAKRIKLESGAATPAPTVHSERTWYPQVSNSHHEFKRKQSDSDTLAFSRQTDDDRVYSLAEFQQRATELRDRYLGETPDVTEYDVEREFWRRVKDQPEKNTDNLTQTEYAFDLPVRSHGSGFAQPERDAGDPAVFSPWNLNALPFAERSFGRYIDDDVPALVEPKLDVGAVFSAQSWGFEDAFAYLVSYHHFGTTRTWYAVPEKDEESFRGIIAASIGDNVVEDEPSELLDADCMLPPDSIRSSNASVYSVDQRPGEIIIVFPQAYTCHFNHGFNLVESVNVLPVIDWLSYGREFETLCRQLRIEPPFSINRVLLNIAASSAPIATAKQ